jgi:hypothetical protein
MGFENQQQADGSTIITLEQKIYPSRSQISPFYPAGSAICDRGHYNNLSIMGILNGPSGVQKII